jgi:hypothetical protein
VGALGFERLRSRWEDNIKLKLKEIKCESVKWILLPQDII